MTLPVFCGCCAKPLGPEQDESVANGDFYCPECAGCGWTREHPTAVRLELEEVER